MFSFFDKKKKITVFFRFSCRKRAGIEINLRTYVNFLTLSVYYIYDYNHVPTKVLYYLILCDNIVFFYTWKIKKDKVTCTKP